MGMFPVSCLMMAASSTAMSEVEVSGIKVDWDYLKDYEKVEGSLRRSKIIQ